MTRDEAREKIERYQHELRAALATMPTRDPALEQAYERILEAILALPDGPRDREISELSVLYTNQRRFDDAAALYKRLSAKHQDRRDFAARAHYFRGLSLIEIGAPVEARHHLRHALAIDPILEAAQHALDAIEVSRLVAR